MVFQAPNCPLPPPNLVIENAQFVFSPNFEGREGRYNEEGERSFNVRVPDNVLEAVTADNWNVKWTSPKTDEREPEPYIEVAIGFKYRPPTVMVIEDGNQTVLSPGDKERNEPDTVKMVDKLQFEKMDIVLRGRDWKNQRGECGIKAWLQTFVGVVENDDIVRKYRNMRNDED